MAPAARVAQTTKTEWTGNRRVVFALARTEPAPCAIRFLHPTCTFSMVQFGLLRAYHLPDWTQAESWILPGAGSTYFTTHPDARGVNAFHGVEVLGGARNVVLALKTPGSVYRLPLLSVGSAVGVCM